MSKQKQDRSRGRQRAGHADSAGQNSEQIQTDPNATLVQPPVAARRRIESIPLLFGADAPPEIVSGKVVYDSWAHGPAMALRDATDGHIRRLRLKAGNASLEILAERTRDNWSFVARVYRGRKIAHDFVLKIGGRKFLAGPGGYYQWSSSRVPRQFALLSYDAELCFDEVRWS